MLFLTRFLLKLSILFVARHLRVSLTAALPPFDSVVLNNTRVDNNGKVSVDIIIKAINFTKTCDEIQAILSSAEGETIRYSLGNLNSTQADKGLISCTLHLLEQDHNYSLYFQSNGTILSRDLILLTTGLQSIDVCPDTTSGNVTCKFLLASRADGCLLEWKLSDDSEEQGRLSIEIIDGIANGKIEQLSPGKSYQISGFGLSGGKILHTFPLIQVFTTSLLQEQNLEPNVLVITISATLSSLFFVLLLTTCLIVISKCQKGVNSKNTEQYDTKGVQRITTTANICYEEVFYRQQSLEQHILDPEAVHLYDDVISLHQSSGLPHYENVDPVTNLPVKPKPFTLTRSDNTHGREHLNKPQTLSFKLELQHVTKKARSLDRGNTFRHQCLELQKSDKEKRTVSAVIEAAEYEIPIPVTDV